MDTDTVWEVDVVKALIILKIEKILNFYRQFGGYDLQSMYEKERKEKAISMLYCTVISTNF